MCHGLLSPGRDRAAFAANRRPLANLVIGLAMSSGNQCHYCQVIHCDAIPKRAIGTTIASAEPRLIGRVLAVAMHLATRSAPNSFLDDRPLRLAASPCGRPSTLRDDFAQ